jgi:hypothetical protein
MLLFMLLFLLLLSVVVIVVLSWRSTLVRRPDGPFPRTVVCLASAVGKRAMMKTARQTAAVAKKKEEVLIILGQSE